MRYRVGGVVAATASAVLVAACGSSHAAIDSSASTMSAAAARASMAAAPTARASAGTASSESGSATAGQGTLTVFAAASLKKTFTKLGATFEGQNAGSKVTFSFAGSSDLVAQLIAGNQADVFASADTTNMNKATAANLVQGNPVNFATNTLTIVVPPDNPGRIASFADLAKPGLALVVCAPQVPCGSAAKKLQAKIGTQLKPVSEESSVTDVLTKVTSGEADAGLVYVTDAAGVGDKVKIINFPESEQVVNTYPIAVLKGSSRAALAKKFTVLITGSRGQQVLKGAGFAPAP